MEGGGGGGGGGKMSQNGGQIVVRLAQSRVLYVAQTSLAVLLNLKTDRKVLTLSDRNGRLKGHYCT